MIPVALLVTVGVFALARISPVDPVLVFAGEERDPAMLEAIRHQLGLDQPLPVQYVAWLSPALQGDLGRSFQNHHSVTEALSRRLTATFVGENLRRLVLPAIALATGSLALNLRQVRSSLLEVFGHEYMRTARAKGLRESAVIIRHALKNALIPVVTLIGIQIGAIIEGAVITETIFSWPGVGRLAVQAIPSHDYPVVQGVVLVSALSFMLSTLLVDVLYAWLDPRIA